MSPTLIYVYDADQQAWVHPSEPPVPLILGDEAPDEGKVV